MTKNKKVRKWKNGDHVAAEGKNAVVSTERGSGGQGKVFADYVDENGDVSYYWFEARHARRYRP